MSSHPTVGVTSEASRASAPAAAEFYPSCKLLWQLVTEQAVKVSNEVIERQLRVNADKLEKGLAFFVPKKGHYQEPTAEDKLGHFLQGLAQLLGLTSESLAKGLLTSYLAGDFRGTKKSLSLVIASEHLHKPFLMDIWRFYRSERLYLLQVRYSRLLNVELNADFRP